MGIFLAIAASVLQALAFTVLKRSYQNFPPSVMFFFLTIFGALIWMPYALFVGFSFNNFGMVLIYAFISTILAQAIPSWTFTKGELAINGSLFATYPMYTVLFSLGINGESLTIVQWTYVALTFIGTLLVSLPATINRDEFKRAKLALYPILAAVSVGFSDALSKHIINEASAQAFLFALAITQFPVALIFLRIEKQSFAQFTSVFTKWKEYKYSVISSFLLALVLLTLFLAFAYAPAAIAAPITGSYPALLVILAAIFFKEKLSVKSILGVLLVLFGVIGIGYYSG